ncbi:hypothetical protein DL98DRAFT_509992 [Cadophora sp. DSE1049]|nr:hypothetical protein DL98DRAFT_509992 [Cadophora sp. DSE1049]
MGIYSRVKDVDACRLIVGMLAVLTATKLFAEGALCRARTGNHTKARGCETSRLRSLHTTPCTSQPNLADSLRLLYSLLAGPDSLVLLGFEVTLNST